MARSTPRCAPASCAAAAAPLVVSGAGLAEPGLVGAALLAREAAR